MCPLSLVIEAKKKRRGRTPNLVNWCCTLFQIIFIPKQNFLTLIQWSENIVGKVRRLALLP
jgi:hypothetical protein